MALRSGHGKGGDDPRVEVLPADELPEPVAAAPRVKHAPIERRENGTFAGPDAARAAQARATEVRSRRLRIMDALGLRAIAEDAAFYPYRAAAEEFQKEHASALAHQGDGELGPGPQSLVASAALQLGASRFCFDLGVTSSDPNWIKLGTQLANDSRQNLLAAYELAMREAKARQKIRQRNPLAQLRARTTSEEKP